MQLQSSLVADQIFQESPICGGWEIISAANDRAKVFTSSISCRGDAPPDADAGVCFVAFGGQATVARVKAWEMGSIWERKTPAAKHTSVRFQPTFFLPSLDTNYGVIFFAFADLTIGSLRD